jgi:hypothetical protein
MNWIDARIQEIFVTVGMGVSMGTLWRMVMRPETNMQRFLARAFICLTVGIVAGSVITKWFVLDGIYSIGVGTITGFLSEEILLFFQARGRKLEQGKIDTSLKGDDRDE